MKLFRISQSANIDYDTYDSAVVSAETKSIARNMNPMNGYPMVWDKPTYTWCSSPKDVYVEYLGEAKRGTKCGVICASFNAG